MLALEDRQTGFYKNPDWTPATPGLFAIIIGVSRYPHLTGGALPATETYGFEQLATAAQTAYRIFRWLRERYELPNVPLATCRLLLSPSDREEKIAAADRADPKGGTRLADISALPTLKNCSKAIRAWCSDMSALSKEAGKQSRALFVFCGHGLQSTDRPLLLPSDWLGPDEPNPNDAISTQNLVNGLSKVPVRQQWFFCDACRVSTPDLNQFRDLSGRQILDETFGEQFERSYPIVYSSARGMPAFESSVEECTIFGGSLLDGLYARVPYIIQPKPRPARIAFTSLLDYLRRETHRRLEQYGQEGTGVVLTGQYLLDNPVVTNISKDYLPANAGQAELRGGDQQLQGYSRRPFGPERWARFFTKAQISGLTPRQMENVEFTVVRSDLRKSSTVKYTITISLPVNASTRWIQFVDEKNFGGCGAVFLTRLPPGVDSLLITATASMTKGITQLDIFRSRSASHADDPLANLKIRVDINKLYMRSRTTEPIEAATSLASQEYAVIRALKNKKVDPILALEAALILLRSGRFGALYGKPRGSTSYNPGNDWLVNLADRFPQIGSDACILVAQRLIADPNGTVPEESTVARIISEIAQRGMPYTTEAADYLYALSRRPYPPHLMFLTEMLNSYRPAIASIASDSFETRGLFAVYKVASAESAAALARLLRPR